MATPDLEVASRLAAMMAAEGGGGGAAAGGGAGGGALVPAGAAAAALAGAVGGAGGGGTSAMMSTDAPSIIEHFNASVAFVPSDTRWVPGSAMFVAMGGHPRGTGALAVYKMTPEGTKVVAQYEKPSTIKCGTFAATPADARHIAVGDHAGTLAM